MYGPEQIQVTTLTETEFVTYEQHIQNLRKEEDRNRVRYRPQIAADRSL